MRKFLGLFFAVIIFLFAMTFDSGGNLEGEGIHEFYLIKNSSNANITRLNESETDGFIYLKANLKGESVVFYDREKVERLKTKLLAKKILCEEGDGFYCEYYYSPFINGFTYIDGQKINVHVAYSNGIWVVGTPIIYGSF